MHKPSSNSGSQSTVKISRLRGTLLNTLLLAVVIALCWLAGNAWVYHQRAIDERSIAEVVADEWPKDHNVMPLIAPSDYVRGLLYPTFKDILPPGISMPLGGVPNVRSVYCQEDDGWYIDRTDRYGFLNPDSAWDQPIDILLIGPSFANGACTAQNSRFYLGKHANTVTLGSGGAGPLLELATLREFLLKYKTRHVVWYMSVSDPFDLVYDLDYPPLRAYLNDPKYVQHYFYLDLSSWRERGLAAIPPYLKVNEADIEFGRRNLHSTFYDIVAGTYLLPLISDVLHPWLKRFEKTASSAAAAAPDPAAAARSERALSAANIATLIDILHEANAETEQAGAKLTILLLPSKTTCYDHQTADFFLDLMKRFVREKLDYINGQTLADHDSCPDLFVNKHGGHFSDYGYEKLAELIWYHIHPK